MTVTARGGQLWIDVTVGKRRWRAPAGTENEAVAKRLESQVRRALLRGEEPALGPLTFGAAVDAAWERHYRHSRAHYVVRYTLEELKRRIGVGTPLSNVDEDRAAELIAELRGEGDTNATINRKLSALRRVLKVSKAKLERMPDITLLTEVGGRKRVVTPEEEAKVLDHFNREGDTEMADLTVFLVDTGARLGEALRLLPEACDFVRAQVTFWKTKGGEPRSVPMTQRVRAVLDRRCNSALPVFASNKDNIERRWARMRKALGLASDVEFVMHALRHTCASRLLDQGVDLYTIKTWLGHASITTTEGYAHLSTQRLAEARDALEGEKVRTKRAPLRAVDGSRSAT